MKKTTSKVTIILRNLMHMIQDFDLSDSEKKSLKDVMVENFMPMFNGDSAVLQELVTKVFDRMIWKVPTSRKVFYRQAFLDFLSDMELEAEKDGVTIGFKKEL